MDNLHIEGSSDMTRNQFREELWNNWDNPVTHYRGEDSLLREWAAHKLLYRLGLWKSRTYSVDLNYPQTLAEKVGYFVVGVPALWLYE